MSLPKKVKIVEVGPRDGLQNEQQPISTEVKIELIHRLVGSGLSYIEAGSFVNPKWVPQMAGSDEVFKGIERTDGVTYAALIPNFQGFERAVTVQASEVAIFAAASESFSQKNINCSIDESLDRFTPIMEAAKAKGLPVRGYISWVALTRVRSILRKWPRWPLGFAIWVATRCLWAIPREWVHRAVLPG